VQNLVGAVLGVEGMRGHLEEQKARCFQGVESHGEKGAGKEERRR